MKTIQVGTGKVRVIQFETLKELKASFTEEEIVSHFNFAYKSRFQDFSEAIAEERSKEVK